jgi:putative Mn2+ efflux pump MntP
MPFPTRTIGLSPLASPIWLAALLIGLVSAAMSCVGLYGALWVRQRFAQVMPERMEIIVGCYLCALAIRMAASGA